MKREMKVLESAFSRILGFYPTYMRAPYLEHSNDVLDVMKELGYRVVGASVDTKDYMYDNPGTNWLSFERFLEGLNAGGTVVLAHDVHRNTVEILVENMLSEIEMRGLSGEFDLVLVVSSANWVQLLRLASVLVMISGIGLSSCPGGFTQPGIWNWSRVHERCFCTY